MTVAVAAVVAACTGGGHATKGTKSDTLRLPLQFSMQAPDPAIFFQAEGFDLVKGAYEGLVRYKPNTAPATIQPWLATSYDTSSDGLTYTFHLRSGVHFHDGTTFDAAAAKFSIERTMKINAGPAEATYGIKTMETPDSSTLVVHMSHPVAAFLSFMASSYGPKMMSPTAITAHQVGTDLAQKWMLTHDAGTGPYQYASITPQQYTMTRFDGYWGPKAGFEKVIMTVIPSFTTQELELRSGQLDMMPHGVPTRDLDELKKQGFSVWTAPTFLPFTMWVNPEVVPLPVELRWRSS